jgi:hypothetical protein
MFFAPGIGVVSLHRHQFKATCGKVFGTPVLLSVCSFPTIRITSSNPGNAGNTSLYAKPRNPGGGFCVEYLPVNKPSPSGLYAISLIPSSSHVSRVPLVSGKRDSRWYCTCSVAIGTLRFAMYFATAFVVKKNVSL